MVLDAAVVACCKLIFFLLRVADKLASFLGYKIFQVTCSSVFRGQPPEVVAEAAHEDVVTPLGLLIDGLQTDRQLDVIGRIISIQTIRLILRKRVGISKAISQHPQVLKTEIRRPIFIVGFPRTGTTMLYNLLAQDPQFRTPMLWEIVEPYPPGRPDNWRESERYRWAKKQIELRLALGACGLDVAHVMRADHPEECQFALIRSFLTYQFFLRLESLSALEDWFYNLSRHQIADIYRYYKKQLQLMAYNGSEKQIHLLKAHIHLVNLDALLDVFPDARLIFTYRPMTEIIPSFCSTVYRGTAGLGPCDAKYGKRVTRMLSEFANRGVATMKRFDNVPEVEQPFYNVAYSELQKDPINVIKGIYAQYGLTYSPTLEAEQRAWLAANPQHKHGEHKYSMQQYGLTETDITDAFGPYLEYFKNQPDILI